MKKRLCCLTLALGALACESQTPVDSCTSNADCEANADLPGCDPQTKICMPVLTDGPMVIPDMAVLPPDMTMCNASTVAMLCMTPQLPACDMATNKCVKCTQDMECMRFANTTKCDSGGSGACVQCLTKDDCASLGMTCNAMKQCVPCTAHTDCSSGVCLIQGNVGTCVALTDVAVVDKSAAGGCMAQAEPYCEIADAIVTTKPYIRVVAGEYSKTVDITSGMKHIIGPGRLAASKATLRPVPAGTAIFVHGGAKVIVDGIEVTGALLGVHCDGVGSEVTLQRSIVHTSGTGGVGVSAQNGCRLVLDANQIGPGNQGGGVALGGSSTYDISNNFIVGNVSSASPGVALGAMTTGTFQFNTVADNVLMLQGTPLAGGVDCGGAGSTKKTIESSLVMRNSKVSGNTQLFGNCQLINVVTGADTGNPGSAAEPDLTSAYYLMNSAPSQACCIDKIDMTSDGGAAMLPNHDVDFNRRPMRVSGASATWDIGAHELQQ